ncbi:hypothetical protein [Streptomyces sp. NPDC048665]|uniref:hypothetical protein n=1 Tax=Streptomyces sp. NPDC048665 TaxID=3155490 RepID=UPI0034340596
MSKVHSEGPDSSVAHVSFDGSVERTAHIIADIQAVGGRLRQVRLLHARLQLPLTHYGVEDKTQTGEVVFPALAVRMADLALQYLNYSHPETATKPLMPPCPVREQR